METKGLEKLNLTYKRVSELKENPHNPRIHSDAQLKKLEKSISEFGMNIPIIVDEDGNIISGNAVFRAAKQLGHTTVPTVAVEHLTPSQKKAFVIAINRIAEDAEWDNAILKEDFEFLIQDNFELELSGFDVPEIDVILNMSFEGGEEPEIDESDILPNESEVPELVKPGDLYQLGKHKVLCGNSLNNTALEVLMDGKKADMVFTDPPYNVKVNGHISKSGKHQEFAMASGEMTQAEFTGFLNTSMTNLKKHIIDGSILFICMDWKHTKELLIATDGLYELKNICVWDKGSGGMGSLYRSQHEFIFVFKKGKASHINNVELGKHGRYRTNIWQYPGVRASNPDSLEDLKLHPTVKNVSMVADAILDCSNPNDIILDIFAGSGTTLLAAEKTKRKAYVIEYEPHYCDVIIYRWEKLTGKKAQLLGNYGDTHNE